jgi:DNA repair protein RadC
MLAASPEARLRALSGDRRPACFLEALREAMGHTAALRAMRGPLVADRQALIDYLRIEQAFSPIEIARVLHLDARNRLIRDEVVARGTIDEAAIHVREVIRRAIELNASALILVHNHPSGDATPSRADIELTRNVSDAGRRLGIVVHDHIIVSSEGFSSMREAGLL